jgi:hypothetical protein
MDGWMDFTHKFWIPPTRFARRTKFWGPIKWTWGNRILVFRSTTFGLDSFSGILGTGRQPFTRVPCWSPLFLTTTFFLLTFLLALPRQCGGAQRKTRPKTLKRRHRRADRIPQPGPSNHTGAQTAKKRKPGSRVTKDFGGDGKNLNDGIPGGTGTGFKKRAQRYSQA